MPEETKSRVDRLKELIEGVREETKLFAGAVPEAVEAKLVEMTELLTPSEPTAG